MEKWDGKAPLYVGGAGSGGVAWWAHIAGFAYGFVVMGIMTRRERARDLLVQ